MSFRLPTLTLGRNSNHARRRWFSVNCGEIPEMSNPSLSKLGFNLADETGHMLLEAVIQSKEEHEKGLSL